MAKTIKIKKGLDINLKGRAPKVEVTTKMSSSFGIVPEHYDGFKPRLMVKVGDRVLAGSPVMYQKGCEELVITSPVSGEVVDIKRGEKRRILYVEIKADEKIEYKSFSTESVPQMGREALLRLLLSSGLLALVKQRPFDIIIDPQKLPRDIFISGYYSAPLMPDAVEIAGKDMVHAQAAIDALAKLTEGQVYLSVKKGEAVTLKNCQVYEVDGPHPSGNVGVLINHTKPINKGETVWTLSLSELILIGRFLTTGRVDHARQIAFAGSRMKTAGYGRIVTGAEISALVAGKIDETQGAVRIIDGNVLTGRHVAGEYRFLSPFSNIITAIPSGEDVHDMFGWVTPGFDKFSMSRLFPTALFGKSRTYDIDARIRGGQRAIIVSNEYDRVFPMDIFPEQLIKSIIAFDIDRMEELGIYEIAPEDFALCEFVDTSKLELQHIVRKGLDELYKEVN